jgi:hypothetical protein
MNKGRQRVKHPCGDEKGGAPLEKTKRLELSERLLAKNTLLNFPGQAVSLFVGVAIVPFIVRGLRIEHFGKEDPG